MPIDQPVPMVLRSIHLPQELDNELRRVAFLMRRSKAELIRSFVATGLKQLAPKIEGADDERLSRIAEAVLAVGLDWTEQLEENKAKGLEKGRKVTRSSAV